MFKDAVSFNLFLVRFYMQCLPGLFTQVCVMSVD